MVNNIFMCSKKTAKILGLFYIFLLYSSNSAIEEEENEFKEELPEKDNFNKENKKGNAFVKFFKYGKHSLIWRGINGGTAGFLNCYLNKPKDPETHEFCINTKADIILNLFSFCYDCKYMIKDRLGLFLNCSCFGEYSAYDLLNNEASFPFLNINFGVSYVLLHDKNFLWNIYAGIGVTWGFSPFSRKHSYNVDELGDDDLGKTFEKDIKNCGGLLKSGLWKNYFYCKQFKQNIKHFDVIIDCSVFDFTIKDHFRVTLEWKGRIGNIYKTMLNNNKDFTKLLKFFNICLTNLSINIGYVF